MKFNNYINGKWKTSSNEYFDILNPYNGEVINSCVIASKEDIKESIDSAYKAFQSWSALSNYSRSDLLEKLYTKINENEEALAKIITLEQGKPLKEALGEVKYGAGFIKWYAEEAKRIYGDILPHQDSNKRISVIKNPVGVVAAITPWNFPFAMITRKLAPALASGCSIIIKPSKETPLTAIKLMELIEEVGFPNGTVNLVTGNSKDIASEFLENRKVSKITFTGSTEVGKYLYEKSAYNIKRLSLELGGHAPFIVFEDADLENAVNSAIASKLRNCGQVCIASNKFLIHKNIKDKFINLLKSKLQNLKLGSGLENVDLGPIINESAYKKIIEQIEDSKSKGGVIEYGGDFKTKNSNSGYFISPTIISNVDESMICFNEESFGPLIPIIEFNDIEEALYISNNSNYGLAAYIFSENYSLITKVSEKLQYGMVGVNDGAISCVQAPFGGFKESGIGREGGYYGIEEFLETKYISIKL